MVWSVAKSWWAAALMAGLLVGLLGGCEDSAAPSRASNSSPSVAQPPAVPQFHIVICLVDTMRADRVGAYGYQRRATTPNIDALATRGVVFEHANAAGPWTLPSVASLFTSHFPCEHRVISRHDRLNPTYETLAERMSALGFSTVCLSANRLVGPQFGLTQGFDVYVPSGRNGGDQVAAAIDGQRPPYFVYVHNLEPHNPYMYAPERTAGFRTIGKPVRGDMRRAYQQYKRAAEFDYRNDQPLGQTDYSEQQDQVAAKLVGMRADWNELYDATIHYSDSLVGSIIEMLEQRGIWRDTLFIMLSDHGEEFGDHGAWLHDQSVYEEMMRVPLIVRFPGDEFAGKRVSAPVSLVDLLPTLCDYLAHPDMAGDARGRSLMPLVRGQLPDDPDPFTITGMRINRTRYYRPWVQTRGDVNVVVRDGHWKGIWNADLESLELYDLDADPRETTDLSAAHPELAKTMQAAAREWMSSCNVTEPLRAEPLDDKTMDELRSLGYVD
jgi:arylsulfatase A-like enzyme